MTNPVYVFKNSDFQPFYRVGECKKCGKCCASLTNRSFLKKYEEINSFDSEKVFRMVEENDVLIFSLTKILKDFVVLGTVGSWDYAEFLQFQRNSSAKSSKEMVQKLGEKFPGLTANLSEELSEEESCKFLEDLPMNMRVLPKGKYHEIVSQETFFEAKTMLDENPTDDFYLTILLIKMIWDEQSIGCGLLAEPNELGQQLCLDYLDQCDFTNKAGLNKAIPMAGKFGRPMLCQISPIHPDEIEKYGCEGYKFEAK